MTRDELLKDEIVGVLHFTTKGMTIAEIQKKSFELRKYSPQLITSLANKLIKENIIVRAVVNRKTIFKLKRG